ncbi:MAG: SURF1 family protein [Methylomonas sp.]|nr:SURF1 family protein [Methylomonas sp.]PPD20084.1 MAG: hypothetical protein CTY23_10020 [Methylomonas sp.]PPD26007.1 MAG: hypothetical protein CTY22_06600 [Methylomonas sp.]PPD37736.1 MAG: hypothetical protein CTY21_06595 [Methylomonas sp.]PPD39616.1 MAG: hypothetical protein CTY17_07850 [Methylomonas sp.]
MKFRVYGFEFVCSGLLLSSYLVAMIILCSLGAWQIARSEEKRVFLVQQQAAIQRDVIHLNDTLPPASDELRYRRATAHGRLDAQHVFLIDNQIVSGKPGYFVLSPFLIDGQQQAIMVNRGWIAAGADRKQLPDISIPSEWTSVSGRLNHFPEVGYKLKGAEIPSDGWPSLVQLAEADALSQKLGYPVYPFQLELDADWPDAYLRQWKTETPIPPEKHLAYAVQWFGLALALTCLFIWNAFKKYRGQPTQKK